MDSTDISQVNQHFPTAKVSLVDFPEAELITSAFTITVRMNCLYIDISNNQWTSNNAQTKSETYTIGSGNSDFDSRTQKVTHRVT